MAGNLFQSIISLTDTLFMGRVGENELAACGVASMYYTVLSMIGYSLAIGGQILIARRAGENRHPEIGVITRNLLYLLGALGVLFFLFIRFFSGPLLDWLFSSPDVLALSLDYLRYRAYGALPIFLVFALGGFYMGIGRTRVIIWSTGSMALSNIFLNYTLIFGKLGFPAMGIEGAGLASMLAEYLACAVVFIHLYLNRYPRRFGFFLSMKMSFPDLKTIYRLAGPIVLQTLTGAVGWFIFFIMIENYLGKHDLAVSNVLKIYYLFFSIPARGLAAGTNTLVSNVLGQQAFDRLYPLMWRIILLSVGITLLVSLPLILAPYQSLKLITHDVRILEDGLRVVPVMVTALLALSVSAIVFRVVTGAGAVGFALRAELLIVILYLVYCWLLLDVLQVNLIWAWTSEWFYWLILAIGSGWYVRSRKWQHIRF